MKLAQHAAGRGEKGETDWSLDVLLNRSLGVHRSMRTHKISLLFGIIGSRKGTTQTHTTRTHRDGPARREDSVAQEDNEPSHKQASRAH